MHVPKSAGSVCYSQRDRTCKLFFRLGGEAVRWGARPARRYPQGQPSQSSPFAIRGEPEPTNAPEGGGTTQRGDPAPGPM